MTNLDMSKVKIEDAEMPKQSRLRPKAHNPFTDALKETLQTQKSKKAGPFSTAIAPGERKSELQKMRELIRRAANDLNVGCKTIVNPLGDDQALLYFKATTKRVLTEVTPPVAPEITPPVASETKITATPAPEPAPANGTDSASRVRTSRR